MASNLEIGVSAELVEISEIGNYVLQWTSGDQGSILFSPGARPCMNLGEILECFCASVGPAVSRVQIFLLGRIVGLLYHCNTKSLCGW